MLDALAHLERDYARNQFRAILRAPQRLAIWIPTLLAILMLYAFRIGNSSQHRVASFHQPFFGASEDLVASTIGYLFIARAAVGAALALGGKLAVFRTPAEAVLFSNVGMKPLTVAVWLQFRKLASSFRILTSAIYVFVFVTPAHASPIVVTRGLAIALMSFAIPACIELPAFLFRRTVFANALRGAMWAIAGLSVAAAGGILLGGPQTHRLLADARVDPGPFVRLLANGDPLAAAVIAAIVLALCGSISVLGRDAIPDFYNATTQTTVQRARRRRDDTTRTYAAKNPRWQMPMGPFAYVWKDWIGFRRGRGKFQFWIVTIGLWCAAGAVTSLLHSPAALAMLAFTCVMFLVGVAPVTAAEDLATDLSKPIFWLSHDSVPVRLAAITFGRASRTGLALGLAPLCASFFDGNLTVAIAAVPFAVVLAWSLQAMGTALYAYFPADVDQKGPIVYLRLILGVVFLTPVPISGIALGMFLGLPAGLVTAPLTALGEGALALWIAAERFERRGGAVYARAAVRG